VNGCRSYQELACFLGGQQTPHSHSCTPSRLHVSLQYPHCTLSGGETVERGIVRWTVCQYWHRKPNHKAPIVQVPGVSTSPTTYTPCTPPLESTMTRKRKKGHVSLDRASLKKLKLEDVVGTSSACTTQSAPPTEPVLSAIEKLPKELLANIFEGVSLDMSKSQRL
jgi:hypothetical protein